MVSQGLHFRTHHCPQLSLQSTALSLVSRAQITASMLLEAIFAFFSLSILEDHFPSQGGVILCPSNCCKTELSGKL